MLERQPKNIYTYRDYLLLPEGARVELIEGKFVAMTPLPSARHQQVLGNLFCEFKKQNLKGCLIFLAPFDVRLTELGENPEEIKNVVQPDLSIICDPKKIDEKGCIGTPDLIVEVISPGSAARDLITKLRLYEKFKVKEYWIVHPLDEIVMVYCLNQEGFYGRPEIYSREDKIKPGTFRDDLEIDLQRVFAEE